jgi:hypothetical protein
MFRSKSPGLPLLIVEGKNDQLLQQKKTKVEFTKLINNGNRKDLERNLLHPTPCVLPLLPPPSPPPPSYFFSIFIFPSSFFDTQ